MLLFDENLRADELCKSPGGDTFARLSAISQEYVLLQIFKLHDPAVTKGVITLGIDYIIKYGGWSDEMRHELEVMYENLSKFAEKIKPARNKVISHHDLATITEGVPVGKIDNDVAEKYFEILQEFANKVHEQTIGGPWPFNDLVKNDVAAFLRMLKEVPL